MPTMPRHVCLTGGSVSMSEGQQDADRFERRRPFGASSSPVQRAGATMSDGRPSSPGGHRRRSRVLPHPLEDDFGDDAGRGHPQQEAQGLRHLARRSISSAGTEPLTNSVMSVSTKPGQNATDL